ncbi:hypothetical protein ARAF_0545 [Arsenophonus endosymbiont of Aleurodicus floccissimus]|nr:hypothetical protein ARAF_0545 [Arsenophonus endosymbiont of Aleurodicus floccissimus]
MPSPVTTTRRLDTYIPPEKGISFGENIGGRSTAYICA